jgi:molecular chaperone GrpE (heat shock protein)
LKEGFENTSRLFFNTLEKFNVKEIKVAVGTKVHKDQVEIVGEEKGTEKDLISKITEVGWEVNGKIIRKPKVITTTL